MTLLSSELSQAGYSVLPDLIGIEEVDAIARRVDGAPGMGTRRLLDAPWCRYLAETLTANELLRELGTENAEPVQCTLFNKSPDKNWLVSLHQDLSIPVAERVSSAHCIGWSEKEGEVFVQPPVAVLQEVLALRVHLDDCDERNGALRVVPGSHRLGRLTAAQAIQARDAMGEVTVTVPRGGAMLLRPLLLHASSKSVVDGPRRVLHFVFGPRNLPEGLRWPARKQSAASDC
jgi:ectoine hydroxylase-related dioxygenase (phytanoyl-CoA dioxygenase family)